MGTKYVALLRGIGPSNPNQRNENLREVAESLGLTNVHRVISSGNVVFETDRTDAAAIEAEMEHAWADQLGFESTTILRSREYLQGLELKPFGDREHSRETYLLTTFAKGRFEHEFGVPVPTREQGLLGGGRDRS